MSTAISRRICGRSMRCARAMTRSLTSTSSPCRRCRKRWSTRPIPRSASKGPAKFFKDVDLNAEPMKSFIAELAQRKTIIDPTLVVWEASLISDGGVPAPAYASYMGILSPIYDRFFKAGGYPLEDGYTRADYTKSWKKLVELVGAHAQGRRHRSLPEPTDRASNWFVKSSSTRTPALRPRRRCRRRPSSRPRWSAPTSAPDRSLLARKPISCWSTATSPNDLGALRRVVTVVSDGYVMDGDALRQAAGFSGRPK